MLGSSGTRRLQRLLLNWKEGSIMSIIHTILPRTEVKRLSQKDNDYFRQKLKEHGALNGLLNKSTNKELLDELECILDSKPIPRRKTVQYMRCSEVKVFNRKGKLVRIEYANGKVKQIL